MTNHSNLSKFSQWHPIVQFTSSGGKLNIDFWTDVTSICGCFGGLCLLFENKGEKYLLTYIGSLLREHLDLETVNTIAVSICMHSTNFPSLIRLLMMDGLHSMVVQVLGASLVNSCHTVKLQNLSEISWFGWVFRQNKSTPTKQLLQTSWFQTTIFAVK